MDILDVVGKIKLDASDYKKGLGEAESMTGKAVSTFSKNFETIGQKISGVSKFVDEFKAGFAEGMAEAANDTNKEANALQALKNKLEMAKNAVKASESEVARLAEEFNRAAKETGLDSEETQKLAQELDKAEKEMKDNQAALSSLETELNNYGKSAEDAGKKSTEIGEKSSETGEKIKHAFGVVGKAGVEALKKTIEITAAAMGAMALGVGALVKKSVDAYGEYQQLAGGAELMWGEAYDTVMEHAENAYKTVGRSQSAYLEQANGFATSLKSSLGGDVQAAAQLADEIIRAQADVVAAQGITAEAAENAFNGILRNNFTMLDNLRLGINPTKEGFQDLIDTVNEWNAANGRATEYTMDNYADMYKALNDYIEMQGLSGYATMEAGDTITGSVATTKAAWENLIVALGDKNANLQEKIDAFVESATATFGNMLPIVEQALNGVGKLVEGIIPKITDEMSNLLGEGGVFENLLDAGKNIIESISKGIEDNLETVTGFAEKIVKMLGDTLVTVLPSLAKVGISIISTLGSSIIDHLDEILAVAGQIISQLGTAILEHKDGIANAAISIVKSLAQFLIDNLHWITDVCYQLVLALAQGVAENAGELAVLAIDLVTAFADAVLSNIDVLVNTIPTIVQSLIDSLVDNLPAMTQAWVKLMDTLEIALPQIIDSIMAVLPQLMDIFVEYWLGEGAEQTFRASVIMFGSLTKALLQIGASVIASIGTLVRNMGSTIAGAAGEIHSAAMTGFNTILTAAKTVLTNALSAVKNALSNIASTIRSTLSNLASSAKSWGKDMLDNFISGITEKFSALKNAMSKMSSTIASYVHFSEPDEGALKDFHTFAPDMMDLFIKGVEDNEDKLRATMYDAFNFGDFYTAPSISNATVASGKSLGESALDKILSNLQINMYNTTEIDGQAIKKDSYKYTIDRLGDETRAVRVSMGGFA